MHFLDIYINNKTYNHTILLPICQAPIGQNAYRGADPAPHVVAGSIPNRFISYSYMNDRSYKSKINWFNNHQSNYFIDNKKPSEIEDFLYGAECRKKRTSSARGENNFPSQNYYDSASKFVKLGCG